MVMVIMDGWMGGWVDGRPAPSSSSRMYSSSNGEKEVGRVQNMHLLPLRRSSR